MLGGVIPLCSAQYERMFNSSRLPGVEGGKSAFILLMESNWHGFCSFQISLHIGKMPVILRCIIKDAGIKCPSTSVIRF